MPVLTLRNAAVLDLVEVPEYRVAFIVMEEWSSQLIPDTPCCLRLFLGVLRSCIEVCVLLSEDKQSQANKNEQHMVFMHLHDVCHLDISLRNLVTDYKVGYLMSIATCIDDRD